MVNYFRLETVGLYEEPFNCCCFREFIHLMSCYSFWFVVGLPRVNLNMASYSPGHLVWLSLMLLSIPLLVIFALAPEGLDTTTRDTSWLGSNFRSSGFRHSTNR